MSGGKRSDGGREDKRLKLLSRARERQERHYRRTRSQTKAGRRGSRKCVKETKRRYPHALEVP